MFNVLIFNEYLKFDNLIDHKMFLNDNYFYILLPILNQMSLLLLYFHHDLYVLMFQILFHFLNNQLYHINLLFLISIFISLHILYLQYIHPMLQVMLILCFYSLNVYNIAFLNQTFLVLFIHLYIRTITKTLIKLHV